MQQLRSVDVFVCLVLIRKILFCGMMSPETVQCPICGKKIEHTKRNDEWVDFGDQVLTRCEDCGKIYAVRIDV